MAYPVDIGESPMLRVKHTVSLVSTGMNYYNTDNIDTKPYMLDCIGKVFCHEAY